MDSTSRDDRHRLRLQIKSAENARRARIERIASKKAQTASATRAKQAAAGPGPDQIRHRDIAPVQMNNFQADPDLQIEQMDQVPQNLPRTIKIPALVPADQLPSTSAAIVNESLQVDFTRENESLAVEFYHQQPAKVSKKVAPRRRKTKTTKITPIQELQLCMGTHLSNNQRRNLKSGLRKLGVNVFSPTTKFDQERKKAASIAKYQTLMVDGTHVRWMTNVEAVLAHRCQTLSARNQLPFDKYGGRLILGLIGDKGAEHVKIGLSIANAPHPNNPCNISLLAIYQGSENSVFMQRAFAQTLLPQINQLQKVTRLPGLDQDLVIDMKIAGDMSYLCKLYGHMGPCALYKCLICPAEDMKSTEEKSPRTLEQMTADAEGFQAAYDQNRPRANQLASLSRRFRSMEYPPMFQIQPSDIVPASLHCLMGLTSGLVKELEVYIGKCDVESGRLLMTRSSFTTEFERRLKKIGVFATNWYQTFSGNNIRKLVKGPNPAYITTGLDDFEPFLPAFLPSDPRRIATPSLIRSALESLGRIQTCAKAGLLTDDEICALKTDIAQYAELIRQEFPHLRTPKFHWIACHLGPFVDRNQWWGLVSEQGIESYHALTNADLRRRSNTKNEEDILKYAANQSCLRNEVFDNTIIFDK